MGGVSLGLQNSIILKLPPTWNRNKPLNVVLSICSINEINNNKTFIFMSLFITTQNIYSALWVMQSTMGLRPMDCINKSGLIKGSEVFWLILQS